MKKDNITITRAEYEQLNKAANAAVEHACELFQAARLVDELKARIAELEAANKRIAESRDRWKTWWGMQRDTHKKHIAELETERDALKDKIDDLEFEVINLTTDVRSVESDAAFHQERWEEAEDHLERAEAARDEWFSKYQVLKERTDNYDFLLHKTREQETAIYRLVKEINKLGG